MDDWRTITLEAGLERLIDYRGKSPPKSVFGVPVISAKVVKNGRVTLPIEQTIDPKYYPVWMTRGLPSIGDIVMTTEGPMGEVAQLDDESVKFALGQRIVCMRGKSGVLDNAFLKFLLISPMQQRILSSYATGTTVEGISQKALRSVPLRIPPYRDQVAIGSTLGALDDKIDLNRRMNETLETITRTVFKDWFVDFGPTRAKMQGGTPYLSPDVWALFPNRLDDEGKPEGWHWSTLAEFMSFQGGTQPPASEFLGEPRAGYVRLLQIRDFINDSHLTFVPQSRKLRMISENDICIGRYGSGSGEEKDSLGRLCRGLSGAINVALVHVLPQFECREFLATFIGSGEFRRAVSGGSARAVQAGFRQEDLGFIKIVKADPEIFAEFEELGTITWESRKRRNSESSTLAATRDLLLPKLMSGEISINNIEKMVEAVL
jgi:type I restriction enzyme S subunit